MIRFWNNHRSNNKNFLIRKANFNQKRKFNQSQIISFLNNSNQILTITKIMNITKRKSQNKIVTKKRSRIYQSRRSKNKTKQK